MLYHIKLCVKQAVFDSAASTLFESCLFGWQSFSSFSQNRLKIAKLIDSLDGLIFALSRYLYGPVPKWVFKPKMIYRGKVIKDIKNVSPIFCVTVWWLGPMVFKERFSE